jgi:hypothetical protein
MINRCTNPNAIEYQRWYGARGVAVCERWLVFGNFLADMGERPPGRTLDRIDTYGHYEPGNCRWATPAEQTANKRPPRPRWGGWKKPRVTWISGPYKIFSTKK